MKYDKQEHYIQREVEGKYKTELVLDLSFNFVWMYTSILLHF